MSRNSFKGKTCITLRDIALTGLMVATIEVAKIAVGFIPNIELTSFLLILFTLTFGRKVVLTVPVFTLLEGMIYGFSLWWAMYLYVWPLLVFFTYLFRKNNSVWFWSIFSAGFGLCFGGLCAIPYFFIGLAEGSVLSGLTMAGTWWVAGIPWDIGHGIGNFCVMRILYYPMRSALARCKENFGLNV